MESEEPISQTCLEFTLSPKKSSDSWDCGALLLSSYVTLDRVILALSHFILHRDRVKTYFMWERLSTVPQHKENANPLEAHGLPFTPLKISLLHARTWYLQEDYTTVKTASSRWHLFSGLAVLVKHTKWLSEKMISSSLDHKIFKS